VKYFNALSDNPEAVSKLPLISDRFKSSSGDETVLAIVFNVLAASMKGYAFLFFLMLPQ